MACIKILLLKKMPVIPTMLKEHTTSIVLAFFQKYSFMESQLPLFFLYDPSKKTDRLCRSFLTSSVSVFLTRGQGARSSWDIHDLKGGVGPGSWSI